MSKQFYIHLKKTLFVFITITLFSISPIKILAEYRNANVILDENYRNKESMTLGEIEAFLQEKGSWLKDYDVPSSEQVPYPSYENGEVIIKYAASEQVDKEGQSLAGVRIPEAIYNLCQKYNINPQVILVMLQKESSSITQTVPSSESRKYWPMFMGYHERMEMCRKNIEPEINCYEPDYYKSRAETYGGAAKQIAIAIEYLDRYQTYYQDTYMIPHPDWGDDIAGTICENAATRTLYRYTPHPQTNFFNIYTSYWGHEPNVLMANDVLTTEFRTYDQTVEYESYKSLLAKAYHQDTLLGDLGKMKWKIEDNLSIGLNTFTITYNNEDGKVQTKTLRVIRHKLGDIDGDDRINIIDLSVLAKNWGVESPDEYMANLNPAQDNLIDVVDLSILASQWEY